MSTFQQLVARALAGEVVNVPGTMTCPEAAAVAATLPAATYDAARPVGVGLYPPRGAEPILTLARRTPAVDGHVVARGARGCLGVLWRGKNGTVHRLFFSAHGSDMRWVDCYADAIASIEAIGPQPLSLTGWQLGLL